MSVRGAQAAKNLGGPERFFATSKIGLRQTASSPGKAKANTWFKRLVAMGNHCGKNELFFDQTKPF
jgi:hypothetical protein